MDKIDVDDELRSIVSLAIFLREAFMSLLNHVNEDGFSDDAVYGVAIAFEALTDRVEKVQDFLAANQTPEKVVAT